ncbi:MAG: HemK/PrmC family methyltransferase, partial [bacterium]
MNIKKILKQAAEKLKAAKIDSAFLDADILLAFTLKKPKEFLYSYPEKKLTKNQLAKFNQLINRRAKREPVAYLINRKEFYGLDFYVDKNVLIPRPLTETLVEEIIKKVKNKKVVIADIGTGSGCIAITLKKHLPQATIYAIDIS